MSDQPPFRPPGAGDDLLRRSERALRDLPIPDGPDTETLTRAVTAARAAFERPVDPRSFRRINMSLLLKVAAAVLAAGAGVFYIAGPFPATASVLFEEAAAKLREARTLQFRQVMEIDGQPAPMASRILYRSPASIRVEPEPAGGPVSIMDLAAGRTLLLDPIAKTAMMLDGSDQVDRPREDLVGNMIRGIQSLADAGGDPIGELVLGATRAQGFRVTKDGQDATVWVDPETRSPIRIELRGQVGGQSFAATLDAIRIDEPLDESLFTLQTPEGYTLREAKASLVMTPEEALTRWLRTYAEALDGAFPPRIDDFQGFGQALAKAAKDQPRPNGPLDPAVLQAATASAHVAVFLQTHRDRFTYRPDGATLGDQDRMIFWYRPQAEQGGYRVLFGDLRFEDTTAERLPETPAY